MQSSIYLWSSEDFLEMKMNKGLTESSQKSKSSFDSIINDPADENIHLLYGCYIYPIQVRLCVNYLEDSSFVHLL